jgi:hypothetical protein
MQRGEYDDDVVCGDNVYKYISKSYMVNNPVPSFVSLFTFALKTLQLDYLKMV